MRNQWRLLLQFKLTRSPFQNPTTTTTNLLLQSQKVNPNFSSFLSNNAFDSGLINPKFRSFSTESVLKKSNKPDQVVILTDILSNSSNNEDIKSGLESSGIEISQEMVLDVLESLKGNPECAAKFFDFVLDSKKANLSSNSYQLMLTILARKDYVEQFMDYMEKMKRRGYRVSKPTFLDVLEKLEKEELTDCLDKLKDLYGSTTRENSKQPNYIALTDILSKSSSNEEIETALESSGVEIRQKMVFNVLKNLKRKPDIVWKFFNYVSETNNKELNSISYQLMLGILARKDYVEQILGLMETMKKKGYRISKGTYLKVLENFEKEEMGNVLDKLKGLYKPTTNQNSKQFDHSVLTEILSKSNSNEEIKTGLESIGISISHQGVLDVLRNLKGNSEVAWKFFNFVFKTKKESLSSKSFDLMIAILGRKDYVEQFWGLIEITKKKGYRITKRTYLTVSENFEKEEMVNDLDKLKELYAYKPTIHVAS